MASARIGSAEGRASVPVAKATQKGLTSAVELRLSYDTRDNRIFPRKGQISTVAWERAEPKIGSDLEYDRWSFRTRWFFPFVLNTTLRLNGSYSFVTTDQPGGMPIFERFFAGGIFDIRGFTRHSLGPQIEVPASRDPGAALRGFVIGGTKKLVLNAEIEFPIFEAARISGVFFLDVGNAYGEDEYPALSLDSTRESVGFGVRWWSPVGPLRFEWGFPLDRLPHEDSMVFEFTIGSSF